MRVGTLGGGIVRTILTIHDQGFREFHIMRALLTIHNQIFSELYIIRGLELRSLQNN